jgi:hypothetical protein
MFEATTLGYSGITGTGTTSNGTTFLGSTGTTRISDGTVGMGVLNPKQILTISNSNNMTSRQVKVAVFTITRDVDTNEITSTKFVKELWVEKKNGTSIDLIVAKQLDVDFDPETTVVKELFTLSF